MAKALFLYSSREGQTKKILNYIKEEMAEFDCDIRDLHTIGDVEFAEYDKVLIGASIRYGHLNKKLYQFIERNLMQLQSNKVAFFCVNLTARKEDQAKTRQKGVRI